MEERDVRQELKEIKTMLNQLADLMEETLDEVMTIAMSPASVSEETH